MTKQQIILPIIILALAGTSMFGIAEIAHAQTAQNQTSLVQEIAQKFHLDQNQVQTVFDQYRGQHLSMRLSNMQQRLENRLSAQVTAGKITDVQKKEILDEIKKLQTDYPVTASMTMNERMQARQKLLADFSAWAKSQNIDSSLVMPRFGRGTLNK